MQFGRLAQIGIYTMFGLWTNGDESSPNALLSGRLASHKGVPGEGKPEASGTAKAGMHPSTSSGQAEQELHPPAKGEKSGCTV